MSRSAHSTLASPATRATTALPPPLSTRSEGPDDPARISPLHLPALHHIAADLDGLDAPVKIVAAVDLGVCVECSSGPNRDLPVWDAVAVVRAIDPYDHESRDEVCAVHLHDVVSQHSRRERRVVVDVPAQGRGFHRDDTGTWYADSPVSGVLVRRMWCGWDVFLMPPEQGVVLLAQLWDAEFGWSPDQARARAEMLGQAVAAGLAADAYEASFSDAVTVALPVVAVTAVAA